MNTELEENLKPKTTNGALTRIRRVIAARAVEMHIESPARIDLHSELTEHWMFDACRQDAEKHGWPLKEGARMSWTSGDTIAKFLQRFDFPF